MTRLAKQHSDFRHPGLTSVDFKVVEMDRVLTAFLARLQWNGRPSRLGRRSDVLVTQFVDQIIAMESRGIGFAGFAGAPDVARRWVETHLADMVHRGLPTQAVAGLRPLHGFAYRYRNSRHSRPYGADEQLWAMLAGSGAKGVHAIEELNRFFFSGIDPATGRADAGVRIDVETQALVHLCHDADAPDDRGDDTRYRGPHRPFCPAQAELLADDTLRLLRHRSAMPRSVLVDYLKILMAFHLALHHLRLVAALPAMVAGRRHRCRLTSSTTDPNLTAPDCPFPLELFVDVAGEPGTAAARLAERSADGWWQGLPGYVRAAYEVKKLDEFGDHLVKRHLLPPVSEPRTVQEIIELGRRPDLRKARDGFFTARLADLVDAVTSEDVPGEVGQLLELGLDDRDTYLEVLTAFRGRFHRKYLTECLDSLLLKNRPGAAIAQPRGGARRFVLDSRLLEVLLQVSLMRPDGSSLRTRPLRVDEFLTVLRVRYGLHVDRLPGSGSARSGVEEHAALRANSRALTARLREIGYYSDLSDAYLTQTIQPRYSVQGPE